MISQAEELVTVFGGGGFIGRYVCEYLLRSGVRVRVAQRDPRKAFFIQPLGLDRHPELTKDYFGNYEKLIYLAQTDDPELDKVAEKAALMLGLTYERRSTGYGDLTGELARVAANTT